MFTLLSVHGRLTAAEDNFNFIHYTNEDGLPSSYVKSIVQDADGFIWIATRLSVSRFDGKEFRDYPFYNKKGEKTEVFCNKLFLTADSVLLARTNDGHYYIYNSNRECFTYYPLLNETGYLNYCYPADGGFWTGHDDNIFYLDKSTGIETGIKNKYKSLNIPAGISFLDFISKDTLLIALSDNGLLFRFDLQNQETKSFDVPEEFIKYQPNLYFYDQEGNLWFGFETLGLCKMNMHTGKYRFAGSVLDRQRQSSLF